MENKHALDLTNTTHGPMVVDAKICWPFGTGSQTMFMPSVIRRKENPSTEIISRTL